ncbi:unnamed protein product [Gadus morhua 'NCC']
MRYIFFAYTLMSDCLYLMERGDSGENFAHALSCDTVTFKLIELLQEYGTGCGLNSKSFVYGEKFFIAVEDALVFIRWPV